jgi:biopolymer transport protein ExbB/TolQ
LADDVDKLKNSLTDVTGGLSTAFDTTLLGLVASIVVQMVMTFRKRQEFLLLDECNEYCQAYVLAKLKLEKVRKRSFLINLILVSFNLP